MLLAVVVQLSTQASDKRLLSSFCSTGTGLNSQNGSERHGNRSAPMAVSTADAGFKFFRPSADADTLDLCYNHLFLCGFGDA